MHSEESWLQLPCFLQPYLHLLGALIRVADRMFRYQSAWPVYAPDQTLTADDLPDYMNVSEML